MFFPGKILISQPTYDGDSTMRIWQAYGDFGRQIGIVPPRTTTTGSPFRTYPLFSKSWLASTNACSESRPSNFNKNACTPW